jgi:hypothetical protein
MMPSDRIIVVAHDLIQVNFKGIDPVWLKSMWDDGETT